MDNQLPPIDRQKVLDRISDIERAIKELERFSLMSAEEFENDKNNFPLASYWLRIAIESLLVIGTHILSRLPQNGKKKDYTQIIVSLGDYVVIPASFANKIRGMAGYRNRLVHLYWQVTSREIFETLKENLNDFTEFTEYIRTYLVSYKN